MSTILFWSAILVLGLYLVAPLVVLSNQRMESPPTIEPITLDLVPPAARGFLQSSVASLGLDGFDLGAVFRLPKPIPNIRNFCALLVNRETQDMAMAAAIFSMKEGGEVLSAQYVEFVTRFSSGHTVNTLNAKALGAFKKGPLAVRAQLPDVSEPRRLWQMHQQVLRGVRAPGKKQVFEAGKEREYLMRVLVQSYEEQARFGRLTYDASKRAFKPTFLGAFAMTWGQLPPMSLLARAAMKREAEALLAAGSVGSMSAGKVAARPGAPPRPTAPR